VINKSLFDTLVPDAPLYRRTDADQPMTVGLETRRDSGRLLKQRDLIPGLQTPSLVSSYDGRIDQLLLSIPAWAVEDPAMSDGYRSVIAALRPDTRFVVVHSEGTVETVLAWFTDAGHAVDHVDLVALPNYVSFTVWAEDGYVALVDQADDSTYLMEPWEFPRAGDALIADAVSDSLPIRTQQAPLIFQGGNCLVGDTFWLLGRDYFADTLTVLSGQRPPVVQPESVSLPEFATQLYSDYVDQERRLILVGTTMEIPLRSVRGLRHGNQYFLDVATDGAGTYQPIFHIDMFITLLGEGADGKFEVMVGDPSLADGILGTQSPWALADVYDAIAGDLAAEGFTVHRNPLVHWPTVTQTLSLAELARLAGLPNNEDLLPAVRELRQAGAVDATDVSVRTWHHITWNNCLVENSEVAGRHVYMPTFGYADKASLAAIDDRMEEIWVERGFEVHRLADFNAFAERQGVVHCIKKYLRRT